MIFKIIDQVSALRWIAKTFQGDKTIITAANKVNCYKLHTINENYHLKCNDYKKDMKGSIFQWANLKKFTWFAAFDNDKIVGVQMYVVIESIGRMWDGFIHAESRDIAIALNKELFNHTKDKWKINYSECTFPGGENNFLTYEDFIEELNYKGWSDAMVPDMYAYYRVDELTSGTPSPDLFEEGELGKLECRRYFLKRFPDSFDEDK
jgi:hypothetical protein